MSLPIFYNYLRPQTGRLATEPRQRNHRGIWYSGQTKPLPACIPVLCKCVPRYSCQADIDLWQWWYEFEQWSRSKESPCRPPDPASRIKMQRAYILAKQRRLTYGEAVDENDTDTEQDE